MVVIDSTGKVWKGSTTAGNDFVATTTVPNFPTTRVPSDAPYPTFVHGGYLYIQNSNNDFYSVQLSNGLVSTDKLSHPFTSTFSFIKIKSYLVDGTDVYVGTAENGIFIIDTDDMTATAL